MSRATAAGASQAPSVRSAPKQLGHEQERGDRPPGRLQHGAADQRDEQAMEGRRGREILEAPEGERGVDGRGQHRADQKPGSARPRSREGTSHRPRRPGRPRARRHRPTVERALPPRAKKRRMPTSVTTGHCRASTAASGASSSCCVLERVRSECAGEAEVGGDPPPDAAALFLPCTYRRRSRAGEDEAGRGGHEQGRRLQQEHRRNDRVAVSPAWAAPPRVTPGPCGKTVTNWHVSTWRLRRHPPAASHAPVPRALSTGWGRSLHSRHASFGPIVSTSR